jgi:hypothetical protein
MRATTMLRICTAALLATLLCSGAALARGGGGGGLQPMPDVNFTDLPHFAPDYRVAPIRPLRHGKALHDHMRWH